MTTAPPETPMADLDLPAPGESGTRHVVAKATASHPAEKPAHTIDPKTGIWPISEWGLECGRGFAGNDYRDGRLPQRYLREIEVSALTIFTGRWLRDYFDRGSGIRYSLVETEDGRYMILATNDDTQDCELRVFVDWRAVRTSDLPESITRPLTPIRGRGESGADD